MFERRSAPPSMVLLVMALVPLGVIGCGDDAPASDSASGGAGSAGETGAGGAAPGGAPGTGGSAPPAGDAGPDGASASGGAPGAGGCAGGGCAELDGSAPDATPMAPEGGSDAGPSVGSCKTIADACDYVDPGTGPVHDCVLLRTVDVATCDAQLDHCRSLCGASLCVRMGSYCHDVDDGNGPLHHCHEEVGHAGVAGVCFDEAVSCLEACRIAKGDPP